MNILKLIAGNASRGPLTLRFPRREVPAPAYRGGIRMDPEKCMACGICDYVCVSAAIALTPTEDGCVWAYDPAGCTYCGRCVDHCPVGALTHERGRDASYGRPGELAETVAVVYPACPGCGRPMKPLSDALLGTAFAEVPKALRERVHLCESCRQKAIAHELGRGTLSKKPSREERP
jgi:hydrogenase-4 component H